MSKLKAGIIRETCIRCGRPTFQNVGEARHVFPVGCVGCGWDQDVCVCKPLRSYKPNSAALEALRMRKQYFMSLKSLLTENSITKRRQRKLLAKSEEGFEKGWPR